MVSGRSQKLRVIMKCVNRTLSVSPVAGADGPQSTDDTEGPGVRENAGGTEVDSLEVSGHTETVGHLGGTGDA